MKGVKRPQTKLNSIFGIYYMPSIEKQGKSRRMVKGKEAILFKSKKFKKKTKNQPPKQVIVTSRPLIQNIYL